MMKKGGIKKNASSFYSLIGIVIITVAIGLFAVFTEGSDKADNDYSAEENVFLNTYDDHITSLDLVRYRAFGLDCDETDDGRDPFEQGTTTLVGRRGNRSRTDGCRDDITLTEYTCGRKYGGYIFFSSRIRCSSLGVYTCEDGACVEDEDQLYCEDTDEGNEPFVFGEVTYLNISGREITVADYCNNNQFLTERYCDGVHPANEQHRCEFGCEDGACIEPEPFCEDSDGGIEPFVAGNVNGINESNEEFFWEDECNRDGDRVFEWYCEGVNSLIESIRCEFGCEEGACLEEEQDPFCEDTDGGIEPFVAGNVSGEDDDGRFFLEDECNNDCTQVHEYYCDDINPRLEDIECEFGCEYGACLEEPRPFCEDSDGGIRIYVPGSITFLNEDNDVDTSEDSCEGDDLTEYYCEGVEPASDEIRCELGCEDNACARDLSNAIFVTSRYTRGDLGGIGGADDFCQESADDAELGGPWIAMLSNSSLDLRDRLEDYEAEGPFRTMNGEVIAEDIDGLFDGNIDVPVGYDEMGMERNTRIWTGTNINGTSSEHNCNDWTSENEDVIGTRGYSFRSDERWITASQAPCDHLNSIYCLNVE